MAQLNIYIHDIQDYWLSERQISLLDYHSKNGLPVNLLIIASYFGEDQPVVLKVKEGVSQHLFQIINHSYDHADLTTLTKDEIRQNLQKAQSRIIQVLGVTPTLFLAPYWKVNRDVLDVAAELGLSLIVFQPYSISYPEWVDGWGPLEPEVIASKARENFQLYGRADLHIHFAGFPDINSYIRTLDLILKPGLNQASNIIALGVTLSIMGLVMILVTRLFRR